MDDPVPRAQHAAVPLEASSTVTARAQVLGLRGVSVVVPTISVAGARAKKQAKQISVNKIVRGVARLIDNRSTTNRETMDGVKSDIIATAVTNRSLDKLSGCISTEHAVWVAERIVVRKDTGAI